MTDFEYDPTAAGFQRDPFPVLKRLRDEHPAYYNERLRFWALSRHDDVMAAAADWELFGNSVALYPPSEQEPTELMPRWMMDFGLFYMDPPRHDRLRALVSKAFTPTRVKALEPVVRELARDLLRRAAPAGRCEIVHEFAAPLATQVIGALLGVPMEDRWQFRLWAEKIEQRDPAIPVEVAEREQAETVETIRAYLRELVSKRRGNPQDDLLSALLAAEIDGERLDDEQVVNMGYQLMIAGNDTTAAMISNGTLRLAENPDQRAHLIADPGLIANGVEEMVRYDSPTVQSPPRITTRDVEMHGQKIRKGQPVVLVWMAANHDDRRYADPGRFDVTRKLGRHMGFGHGLHFCIGANLARLEGRVAFDELLRAMPEYTLEEAALRWDSIWLRPIGSLPICFDAAAAQRVLGEASPD